MAGGLMQLVAYGQAEYEAIGSRPEVHLDRVIVAHPSTSSG
jgi:hypothetical protein